MTEPKLATFRTDSTTWERFQAKAKENGTNASALLQRFVKDYLDGKIDNRIDSPNHGDSLDFQSMINEAIAPLDTKLESIEQSNLEALEKIFKRLEALEQREAVVTTKKPSYLISEAA